VKPNSEGAVFGWKYDMTFEQLIDRLIHDELEYVNPGIRRGY